MSTLPAPSSAFLCTSRRAGTKRVGLRKEGREERERGREGNKTEKEGREGRTEEDGKEGIREQTGERERSRERERERGGDRQGSDTVRLSLVSTKKPDNRLSAKS